MFILSLAFSYVSLHDVIYAASEYYMQIRINFARGGEGPGICRSGAMTFRGHQFRTVAWRSSHAFPRFSVCTCVAIVPHPFFPPNSLIRILPSDPPILSSSFALFEGPLIRTRGRAFRSVFLHLVNLVHIVVAFSLLFPLSFSPTSLSLSLSHFLLHARQNARASLNVIIAWPFGS